MTAQEELTKVVDSLPDLDNINVLDLVVYFLPVFEKVEILEKYMTLYADKNNWYGQDLASSEGRHARECIEKIKAIDRGEDDAKKDT